MEEDYPSIEDLKKDILNGLTQRESGEKYNLTVPQIKRLWKKHSLSKFYREYKEKIEREIVTLYLDGFTVSQLMRKYNSGQKKILGTLKRNGIEITSQRAVADRESTMLERYGKTSALQLDQFKRKKQNTEKQRYNGKLANQSEQVKAKTRKTCRERYGVEYVSQSPEIKEKVKETHFTKNNGQWAAATEEVQEKMKQTCLEKYGVEYVFQSEDVKERIKESCLNKYGVNHVSKILEVRERQGAHILEIDGKKYTFSELIAQYDRSHAHALIIYKRYGKEFLLEWLKDEDLYKRSSSVEQDVLKFIQDNYRGIVKKHRIGRTELDIFIPDLKLAIEVNGVFYHSDLFKEREYHENKKKLCEEHGIKLIHLYECDWEEKRDIIESYLQLCLGKVKKKIYARRCNVVELSKNFKIKSFLNENHIQGFCPSSVRLGLEYEGEIVSVMTFANPRFNLNYEYELTRFCTKKGVQVVGGFSKCFKTFIKTFNPESILSYCNRDYFDGTVYEKTNFTFKGLSAFSYFYSKDLKRYNRVKFQKHKLKNLLKDFDPTLTARENMRKHNYLVIYGCRNGIYEWNRDGK
jgi:hypothetical protein